MQRDDLVRHWDLAWNEGLWHAKWSAALEGVTAEQAARPISHKDGPISPQGSTTPALHSIWQIANHIIFWRTYVIDRTYNGDKLSDADVEERNWVGPSERDESVDEGDGVENGVNEEAWSEVMRRYEQSHIDFRALMADEAVPIETFEFMPFHDSYHVGQIMQLRAGFGLEPIE